MIVGSRLRALKKSREIKLFRHGSGAVWFPCAEGATLRWQSTSRRSGAGFFVDEQNLVTDGFGKAVGCRHAMGRVITGVEQKKKFKSKEQLGSLVKECAAKVEDELRKMNREFQLVTEAGEIGKDLYQPVVDDGDKMDKDQVMEDNEFVGVPIREDHFEEVDGQWNGDGGAGLQQREELGEVDDVFEHEELVEGNLEPIGDGSVGMDDLDQSVKLRCAREGGQLVNRRKVESRKGSQVVKPVRWKLLGSRKPGTRTSELGQVRSPGGTSKEAHRVRKQCKFG